MLLQSSVCNKGTIALFHPRTRISNPLAASYNRGVPVGGIDDEDGSVWS